MIRATRLAWPRRVLARALTLVVLLAQPSAALAAPGAHGTAAPMPGAATGQPRAAQDNNVEWDGVRHDSRDTLYRTPGGAVPAGTPVTLRLRTFHGDVTAVAVRLFDLNADAQQLLPMAVAAADVACYDPALAEAGPTCDFWEVTLANAEPTNLWYRFVVTDGTDTDYYADNTPALDGGAGSMTDEQVDQSWALMVHTPGFEAPAWTRRAVVYQIFPDRFRNGDPANDPQTGDQRYDDPVLALPWGTLPEGYCRHYAAGPCPWRFDDTPPAWSPAKEGPRGRDYMGGDLRGVIEKLDYLKALGVTVIYFNPIFDAASNHSYDTQDYYQIDPYFGTQADWDELVRQAARRRIRIVVDSVFNHMSSDSALFDRYEHVDQVGACEAAASDYRAWFVFREPGGSEPAACAPSEPGGSDTFYDGWFGFDSIPVLAKANPEVQDYFISGPDNVTAYWLERGAAGWRLDVMGDASFPDGYWETFRETVKDTQPDAVIIGELWQKDSTLLRGLRGDRADSTMNYRLRDAVLGLLAPGNFDAKGFADSGGSLEPSEFLARLESVREDYPDAAYYALMNLLDSHDTERLLWTLTPGAETQADREQNVRNVAEGKQRVRLASLIQFTVPGAPTVYYGDEVGLTGDDDPDDRRTYPWEDLGGAPDTELLQHYQTLANLRRLMPVLTDGDFHGLFADDDAGTVAYGRRTNVRAAIVAINRSTRTQTLTIPVAGFVPDGVQFFRLYGVGNNRGGERLTAVDGSVTVTLNPLSGLLLTSFATDLAEPEAPLDLQAGSEGSGQVSLSWEAVDGAAGYTIYRSPVSGGGWVPAVSHPITETTFTDTSLRNAQDVYFVVRAVDAAGNESAASNEVRALPHDTIADAVLHAPEALTHTVSFGQRTGAVRGRVLIVDITTAPGATDELRAQLGYGPNNSQPSGNPAWTWVEAQFKANAGPSDEFSASLLPEAPGVYDYAYRFTTTNGRDWIYADLDGSANGYSPDQAGSLRVEASADRTPPAAPAELEVTSASPGGIALVWLPVTLDPTLEGYEVRRSETPGSGYVTLATVKGSRYFDLSVAAGGTYYYVVRAVDSSFNRSANSNEVMAATELRTVTLTFNVSVPATTDGTGKTVYIAGFLDRLDGTLPQWNPGGVALTQVDDTTWTITLTGKENTEIEYKYALGSWDFVEKDEACGEIANRTLILSFGTTGSQTVSDEVLNWRNVAPCGN